MGKKLKHLQHLKPDKQPDKQPEIKKYLIGNGNKKKKMVKFDKIIILE
jgi:hypothetical protein